MRDFVATSINNTLEIDPNTESTPLDLNLLLLLVWPYLVFFAFMLYLLIRLSINPEEEDQEATEEINEDQEAI